MTITDFSKAHVAQAMRIALDSYGREQSYVPTLPPALAAPDLTPFAENGLGVAALDGDTLIGYLCCYEPWKRHFGLTPGTFSPIHANGVRLGSSARVYDRLYQAAAEKWVPQGILSHAICLYAHDEPSLRVFFDNGFGNRCVDAVRDVSPIAAQAIAGMELREAPPEDAAQIAPLNEALIRHLRQSPMFLPFTPSVDPQDIERWMRDGHGHYFAAYRAGRVVAYLKLQKEGENFITDDTSMMNISGAFALPEVRGQGVYTALLAYVIDWLRERGFRRCGVDFESFNYTARGFWLKHFTAYTSSVARRIDERINA